MSTDAGNTTPLIDAAEVLLTRLQDAKTLATTSEGSEAMMRLEAAKIRFMKALNDAKFIDTAALIVEAIRSRTRYVVPNDAYSPGTVLEIRNGHYGAILMHGWDMEGSFGYFCTTMQGEPFVWTYHKGARAFVPVVFGAE